MINITDQSIIELYSQGKSGREIAGIVGCTPKTIHSRINKLINKGLIVKQPHGAAIKRQSQELHEKVREMLLDRVDDLEIMQTFNIKTTIISQEKTKLYRAGLIPRPDRTKRYVPTYMAKRGAKIIRESTLPEGKTVCCNSGVAALCVYGAAAEDGYLCNYALITGKCRSLGADGCDYKACTKFSRISKENPRISYLY